MMINKVNHWKKLRKPQLDISRFKNDYVVWPQKVPRELSGQHFKSKYRYNREITPWNIKPFACKVPFSVPFHVQNEFYFMVPKFNFQLPNLSVDLPTAIIHR